MPYNSETETFYQAPATVVDSTPDGDTVQEGFDDRLTPAMAGLYADLNLLKADGMISVGIPATTTARGIGRVATSADLVDGATITNGPAFLAAGQDVALAVANFWALGRNAISSTNSSSQAKDATLANFVLAPFSKIFVTFSNANTATGALTLNVNGTGAKPIYNERGATAAGNFGIIPAGLPVEFVYDGTAWRYAQGSFLTLIANKVRYQTGEYSYGTTGIPVDGTIPQITEGDQVMSLSITPKSPNSVLEIKGKALFCAFSYGGSAALFLSGVADAIGVGYINDPGGGEAKFDAYYQCTDMTTKTFTVRCGNSTNGSGCTFNAVKGQTSATFGSVPKSYIEITEYIA